MLAALQAAGYATIPEPGMRIVTEERAGTGAALPWVDMAAFARRALEMARADLAAATTADDITFFDRGLVDAAVALHHVAGVPLTESLGPGRAYANPVFLAPPWREIFVQDTDHRHGFETAYAEYERLQQALQALGYTCCLLPKSSVTDRVDFIRAKLDTL